MRALKRLLLLLLADLQPDLDEPDAAVDDEFLDSRAEFEEALVLLWVQKPMTYSTPARLYQLRSKITISPAGREVLDIALHVHLATFRGRTAPAAPRPGRRAG